MHKKKKKQNVTIATASVQTVSCNLGFYYTNKEIAKSLFTYLHNKFLVDVFFRYIRLKVGRF